MEYGNLIKNFGILNRTYMNYIMKAMNDTGITYTGSICLMNIAAAEGSPQERIVSNMVIDKASIARSIKGLVEAGFVETRVSNKDKRAKELYLTASGKVARDRIAELNKQWVDNLTADMTMEEQEFFHRIINTLGEKARHSLSPLSPLS